MEQPFAGIIRSKINRTGGGPALKEINRCIRERHGTANFNQLRTTSLDHLRKETRVKITIKSGRVTADEAVAVGFATSKHIDQVIAECFDRTAR